MNNWIWVCKSGIDHEKAFTEPLQEKWIYLSKPKLVAAAPQPQAKK